MALFRKFFSRKPPDGLLEISERVYVFDCCLTTDVLEEVEFKVYMGGIVSQLRDHFLDSSFMVFNLQEGEPPSFLSEVLSAYDMTVMDYPRQYEGCPLLTMEMIHHFLRSSESWFSLSHQNILLMHCERGGWPVLAFMLAGLLIYRKQYTGEQKTLDMIYKQAPRELLQLLSPLNPMPSQIRYLQYISRRNVSSIWPPLDRALTLDCVILRFIPNFDGEGGCRPLFRIYGQDPLISEDRTPKVLFSTLKRSKFGQLYRQADCELVKIDIHCHIQGDVVLECISLDDDLKREVMMFRAMFNTAFISSNILMLNRDEIDIMWNAKDRFLKNFRAEVLFSELDASTSVNTAELPHIEDQDGLQIETFSKMQEISSNLVWIDSKGDATLRGLQQMPISNVSKENQDTVTPQKTTTEFMPQKTSPDFFTEKLLRSKSFDVSIISSLTTMQKLDSSLKHYSDTSAMSQNTLYPNVAVFHPTQSRKISMFLESPQSSPVSSTNSLQSSLTHISRYHSAPSSMETLGITALLHDHDVLGRGAHSMTLSPSAPSLLPSETSAVPDPAEMKTASPPTPLSASQQPLLPPSPLPSPLVVSSHATPPCHPSQDSGSPNIQTVPPPSVFCKGPSPSPGPPPPPSIAGGIKGQNLARTMSNNSRNLQSSARKTSLKPLHWVKVTRAVQGSLWAETQRSDEASVAPEFDMSELEGLFSAAVPNSRQGSGDKSCGRSSLGKKSDRVQLIDLQRANNCEIMLTQVKISLTDLLNSVLALDDTVLDVDQVDNLIKFCPTNDEMELLKNFNGDKERLGKCEQYFLELMKVPRVESKLRVFSFKIQFRSQVTDLSGKLSIVDSASQEIRSSVRLKRIMQTILSLGNTINQGTARGSAIGFKLDSLLKLSDTRATNNKLTLMHYLCKVLVEKLPELLAFPKDLVSLEIASKIELKVLAEEMQAISKGLEKVEEELISSENDGPVSEIFCKTLKEFLVDAEAELRALTSLYSTVGRSADALALYFGEDPAHCPFEQVVSTLLDFVKAFVGAHEENCKQLELEKKKQQKIAENEKKQNSPNKEGELTHSPLKHARNT
ncbi:Formin-like protein 6 [Platanthera guangdongensis]|uniref:Formin-like protein n=1 Tax=Platanthera guangdongensis TaxID=2320717 RepID=A0ABR2MEN6_9ASPA